MRRFEAEELSKFAIFIVDFTTDLRGTSNGGPVIALVCFILSFIWLINEVELAAALSLGDVACWLLLLDC